MATKDMNQEVDIIDYYVKNGLDATAKKFNMTKEQLMNDYYVIGQTERGDSEQGGYGDQSSSVKDTLLKLLGVGKASAADGSFVDKNKGMMEQFADYQLDNLGKAREEIAGLPKKAKDAATTDQPGKIDGFEFDEFGRISEDGTSEAEKEDTTAKEYEKPKEVKKDKEPTDEELETMYADVSTGLGLKGERGKDGSLLTGQKKQTEEEDMAVDSENPGMYKPKGANFWSVDTQSPFWNTKEGYDKAKELYGGEVPSFVGYKPEVAELDIDYFKKLLSF